MDDTESDEDETDRLLERVTDELGARPAVTSFDVRPAETLGVVATVETDGGTEYYRVTLETRPDGERRLHWASLGEEPTD